MNYKDLVIALWSNMDNQNWSNLHTYFEDGAIINWHNTDERFTVEEFIRVNAEYPGDWNIKIERLEYIENLVISVVKVDLKEGDVSVHTTSFFEFNHGKIKVLDEYWGDDGKAPQWRIEKQIGTQIV